MSDDFDAPLMLVPEGEVAARTTAEALLFWRYIASSLDRLIAVLDGLPADELNWRPPAPGANSLYALATHTLANAEENLLGVLAGRAIGRDHAAEFAARGESAATIAERWGVLRADLDATLAMLPADALDAPRQHPRRGIITGRDVLIVVARHAAEHLGQAELTRDLLRAVQPHALRGRRRAARPSHA